MTTPVVLVGLGPHARRIYLRHLHELGTRITVAVELESMATTVTKHLPQARIVTVPAAERDAEMLSPAVAARLDAALAGPSAADWRAVLATEPKAHLAYLRYFVARGTPVLVDKPITCPVGVISDLDQSALLQAHFDELAESTRAEPALVRVQCQRRYHPGYRWIRDLLGVTVSKWNVPITSIEVYHCDGMWNMPDELLTRENHPYKYGYGKLLHSGYHFLDLATWLLEANNNLESERRADNCELYAVCVRPNDLRGVIRDQELKALFGDDAPVWGSEDLFAHHGELDVTSIVRFARGPRAVTDLTLNLRQTGFSRRAWPRLPADTYKGNGRVRHERLNVQIGPLLNVQVHSYQAYEVAERGAVDDTTCGGVEHFDIDVFRNAALIGGKPYERVRLTQLDGSSVSAGFIGYNEAARKRCLQSFLEGTRDGLSDLHLHEDSVRLTHHLYTALAGRLKGGIGIERFAWPTSNRRPVGALTLTSAP